MRKLLIKILGKITHRTVKSEFADMPLYKPVKVDIDGMELPNGLIDSCHYIHKSLMYILELQDDDLNASEKADADNSRDYSAAIILQWYFTTWLNDVRAMHTIVNGDDNG